MGGRVAAENCILSTEFAGSCAGVRKKKTSSYNLSYLLLGYMLYSMCVLWAANKKDECMKHYKIMQYTSPISPYDLETVIVSLFYYLRCGVRLCSFESSLSHCEQGCEQG